MKNLSESVDAFGLPLTENFEKYRGYEIRFDESGATLVGSHGEVYADDLDSVQSAKDLVDTVEDEYEGNWKKYQMGESITEAKKKKKEEPDYEKLLNDLVASVETHMQVMSGQAEEGAEDTLESVLAATKEALEPEEEEEEEHEEPEEQELEPEMSEAVKKKVLKKKKSIK